MGGRRVRWVVAMATAVLIAGCEALTSSPNVGAEWESLLADIREFERKIGFDKIESFREFAENPPQISFCGYASRFVLPYSYEDPTIRWLHDVPAEHCRDLAKGYDTYYGEVEALGESRAPVTPEMVTGRFDRFLYLIVHEDCHDQFDLPYGVEEALCNLVTYRAMQGFGREKYWRFSSENRAIRRYADEQSKATRVTLAVYAQLAELYARHARGELRPEPFLQERDAVLAAATKSLGWTHGEAGPIRLANDMTYSRHYPLVERVHDALGRDLARTVAFFKRVDAEKPTAAAILKQARARDEQSLAFIRAYESAVVQVVERTLAQAVAAR